MRISGVFGSNEICGLTASAPVSALHVMGTLPQQSLVGHGLLPCEQQVGPPVMLPTGKS